MFKNRLFGVHLILLSASIICTFFVLPGCQRLNSSNDEECYLKALGPDYKWFFTIIGPPPRIPQELYEFQTQGDTILGGKAYFIVKASNRSIYLRETPGKIYQYISNGEQLVYRMDLDIGDTCDDMRVDAVDTIINSGIARKRITLRLPARDEIQWIEGICPIEEILGLNVHNILMDTHILSFSGSQWVICIVVINGQIVYEKQFVYQY